MADHNIKPNASSEGNVVSENMFGLNFIPIYDSEFTIGEPEFELLQSLGAGSFRFPGGSITEKMFQDVGPSVFTSIDNFFSSPGIVGTKFDDLLLYVEAAAQASTGIQLVLPTAIAFNLSAGQALAEGVYGDRTEVTSGYLKMLGEYIDVVERAAQEAGTQIDIIEIGNEFWGSGQMTASEYGHVVGQILANLDENLLDYKFIAQVVSAANQYSPFTDKEAFLRPDGADFEVKTWFNDGDIQSEWTKTTMPGQGVASTQVRAIAEGILNYDGALENLGGIVEHTYFNGGFAGIDDERDHALRVTPQTFLDAVNMEDIDYHITEWSPRPTPWGGERGNANDAGLQYASSVVEAFYELAENGVDAANFWPLTFGAPSINHRVLIDTNETRLTFGGHAFKLLSENAVGLTPMGDYEVSGLIDIHTYGDDTELQLFISERNGAKEPNSDSIKTEIDLSAFGHNGDVLVSAQSLGEDGISGTDLNATPIFTTQAAFISSISKIPVELLPWGLTNLSIQYITDGDDVLNGTDHDDRIVGKSGNDVIHGGAGNDHISGNTDADQLFGGDGDDRIEGGWGNDTLHGGEGHDSILGNFNDNFLFGGEGNDRIYGSSGSDSIDGGSGNDQIFIGTGRHLVEGGEGNDVIAIESSSHFVAGHFAYNMSSSFQAGTGEFVDISGYRMNENLIFGGSGYDTVKLSGENDAFFLQDPYSEFYVSNVVYSEGEDFEIPMRFSSIERLDAGAGDDLIDLTSSVYSLAGKKMELSGGQGNDTIWGSDADETIFGDSGDDVIFGGAGIDFLSGGLGSDVFEFTATSAGSSITDFNLLEGDRIALVSSGNFEFKSMSFSALDSRIQVEFRDLFSDEVINYDIEMLNFDFNEYRESELLQSVDIY